MLKVGGQKFFLPTSFANLYPTFRLVVPPLSSWAFPRRLAGATRWRHWMGRCSTFFKLPTHYAQPLALHHRRLISRNFAENYRLSHGSWRVECIYNYDVCISGVVLWHVSLYNIVCQRDSIHSNVRHWLIHSFILSFACQCHSHCSHTLIIICIVEHSPATHL